MKKLILATIAIMATGCASIRYPGFESVNIVSALPSSLGCTEMHGMETCLSDNTEAACRVWYQKRAIIYHANTALYNGQYATYHNCHPIVTFDESAYKTGAHTVTGEAFIRNKKGDVISCAGYGVTIHPDTDYFNFSDKEFHKDPNPVADKLVQRTQCNSKGTFKFNNVASGKWVVKTNAPALYATESGYLLEMDFNLIKRIDVSGDIDLIITK